jgi:hypothetical protein
MAEHLTLVALEDALLAAGFPVEPLVLGCGHCSTATEPALRVPMPGPQACALVRLGQAVQGKAGRWRERYGSENADSLPAFILGFHETPFRTRGHPYADPADCVAVLDVDAAVRQLHDWQRWEQDWSIQPGPPETASRRLARLKRLAESKRLLADVPLTVELDPLMEAMLDAGQLAHVHTAVERLNAPAIRWHFPRDKTARLLQTKARVLLMECAPPPNPSAKSVWLVVAGPQSRNEPGLRIRLERVHGSREPWKWDQFPEYWRLDVEQARGPQELWGTDREAEAVAETVELLVAGRPGEALRKWSIDVDDSLGRLMAGRPDRFELRSWTDKWVTATVSLLSGSAPWLWGTRIPDRRRPHRLGSLGGFNPNRRPGIFLARRGTDVTATFDPSASPLVMPRPLWERDPDLDLHHAGLISLKEIPRPN